MKKLLAIIGLTALLAVGVNAQTYGTANLTLAASPQSVAGSSATNQTAVIDVTAQKHISFSFAFSGDAAGTANAVAFFAPSTDGTSATRDTTKGFSLTFAANGTTRVVGTTNLDSSVIGGYGYLHLMYITNAAASGNITNCVIQYGIKRNAT